MPSIGERIVADVQHSSGLDFGGGGELRENPRIGFGGARGARSDVTREQIADAAAAQIGVAVAERE